MVKSQLKRIEFLTRPDAQFRPELKQTEPLIIEEPPPRAVASQGTSPAAHHTMRPPHSVPGLVNRTPGAPPPGLATNTIIFYLITFFTKKEIEFLDKCAFSQILQHDCKNIATILRLMVKMPFDVLNVWDYISK